MNKPVLTAIVHTSEISTREYSSWHWCGRTLTLKMIITTDNTFICIFRVILTTDADDIFIDLFVFLEKIRIRLGILFLEKIRLFISCEYLSNLISQKNN